MEPQPLREAIEQARNQECAVLAIFERLRRPLTPSEVHTLTTAAGKRWPITSIRRAVTGLERETGELVKTDTTRDGPQGRPEYCWRLATQIERSFPLPLAIAGA
jgi:hypothetical protein